MPQNIQMPDGTVAEFPDGMSDKEIHQALSAEQTKSSSRGPVGYVAAKALRGAEDWFGHNLLSPVLTDNPEHPLISPEERLTKVAPWLPNKIEPGNAPGTLSRYAGAAAEGLTGDPVAAMLGPTAALLGALGGEAGADLTGGSTIGRLAGGFLGGGAKDLLAASWNTLTGAKRAAALADTIHSANTPQEAGQTIQSSVKNWMSEFSDKLKNNYQKLDDLMHREEIAGSKGVPPVYKTETVPGTMNAGAPRYDSTGKAVAAPPPVEMSGGVFLPAERDAPLTSTPNVRSEPQSITTVANPGTQGIPQGPWMGNGPQTPLPEFSQTVDKLLKNPDAEGFATALDKISSSGLKNFMQSLQETGMVSGKGQVARPQSWDAVSKLSSNLGDMIASPKNFVNPIEEAKAKALYAALQSDRRAVAVQQGAHNVFDEAQANADALYNVRSKLNELVEPGVDPEKAAQLALRQTTGKAGGGSGVALLRENVPEAADALAAAHLTTSPKDWLKLAPEAKAALVPNKTRRDLIENALANQFQKPTAHEAYEAALTHYLIGEGSGPELLHNALGLDLSPGAAGLTSLAVPAAIRGAKALAQNPSRLVNPLIGAEAAQSSNPLSP
jgi:hypothetical protein